MPHFPDVVIALRKKRLERMGKSNPSHLKEGNPDDSGNPSESMEEEEPKGNVEERLSDLENRISSLEEQLSMKSKEVPNE